jgi:hypothetical protein
VKTKTWKVVANTGKRADLESGADKTELHKPPHISSRDFFHWLTPNSRIEDTSLHSLFKQ